MLRFQGKVAVATGAGRGIGRAIAQRLAAEGASVVVNDIDEPSGFETVQLIRDIGGTASYVKGDVSQETDVVNLVRETVTRMGRLDILVNNAGIDLVSAVQDTSVADWERMLAVDLGGAFLCSKHAQPHLVSSDSGSIVNVSSIHALCTQPGRAAYAAAKSGLGGLTRALALDLGPLGVRVNAVLPGYIRTEIWNVWLKSASDPEEVVNRIAWQHPLRRVGIPKDVSAAVAFLASEDAAFITGTVLVLDGGLTAMFTPPPAL